METFGRSLIQEKAILVARQGDPKNPASGTLLARQKILHVELAAAHRSAQREGGVVTAVRRQPEQIRRDIRRIERELNDVQSRLREIDQLLAVGAERRRN